MFKLINTLFNNKRKVCWLSHHIPKTAGTSLWNSYLKQFGRHNLYRLYEPSKVIAFQATGELANYKNELVVHGHYKPTTAQLRISKDARRVVWLRDPVQRAWSLLHHLVAVQKHKIEFQILYEKFGERLFNIDEDIFLYYLTEKRLKHLNNPYANYFKEVPISDFDFVGMVEKYDSDMDKLSGIMGAKLSPIEKNVRKAKLSIESRDFERFLEPEYEIVHEYYPESRPFSTL